MFGLVEWTTDTHGVRLGRRQIFNLPFVCVSIPRGEKTPEALLRLRCRRAAGKLQRVGVCRAVFPECFPFLPEFARRGILPVACLPLYRAMAAKLAANAMRERKLDSGSARIVVCGEKLTPEVRRCVTELCMQCRYVTLSCPGGEALRRELRREYGAVLTLLDDSQKLGQADLLLRFARRAEVGEGQCELPLYGEESLPEVAFCLPQNGELGEGAQGLSRPQLLSALFAAGILRPGEIEIAGNLCNT